MAKLPRKTQKIFAENSGVNGTAEFGTPQNILSGVAPAYTGDIDLIQNGNFSIGWSSAVPSNYNPFRQDFNSLGKVVTQQLAYLFQSGIPEWSPTTEYYKDASFCQYNGIIYKSLTGEVLSPNLNKNPQTSTEDWVVLGQSNYMPLVQTSDPNGVGYVQLLYCLKGQTYNTLPSGGTWFYFTTGSVETYQFSSGIIVTATAGIAPGGTVVDLAAQGIGDARIDRLGMVIWRLQ